MKKYNFDEVVDRHKTDCIKYDRIADFYVDEKEMTADQIAKEIIPMWVADMDFKTPDFILDAIKKRCEHEVLGYPFAPEAFYQSIVNWLKKEHQWDVEQTSLRFVPGIVPALGHCINAFSKKGKTVVIQPPIYPPFIELSSTQAERMLTNPLINEEGRYKMDYEQLDQLFTTHPDCKMIIVSNPHNPAGRVWSKTELKQLADICEKHSVFIISDEIHADLFMNNHQVTPFSTVSDYAKNNCVILRAPSKTFNIAGLITSYVVVPNAQVKKELDAYFDAAELVNGTVFSYVGAQAAFEQGSDWLKQCKKYLWDNISYVCDYFKEKMPLIQPMEPEATYLIWLDCRQLGLSQEELCHFFKCEAKVLLNDGQSFGQEGVGFMRLNIATPLAQVKEAMQRIEEAYKKRF